MLGKQPTRPNAEKTYDAMFLVIAALDCAMAMTAGTVVHGPLQQAYELLDWAQNECGSNALAKLLPPADLAAAFIRGRDHVIEMMSEAVAIGDERAPRRDLRSGKAQDNFVDSYLDDVIYDPSLQHGFTSIMSAGIQNDTCLEALATITLAEVQAGEIVANGTKRFSGADTENMVAVQVPSTQEAAPDTALSGGVTARRALAFECNFEIQKLAGAVKKITEGEEDRPIFHGIMGRIELMSECVFYLMKLHGEDDAAYEYDFRRVTAVYEGRMA